MIDKHSAWLGMGRHRAHDFGHIFAPAHASENKIATSRKLGKGSAHRRTGVSKGIGFRRSPIPNRDLVPPG